MVIVLHKWQPFQTKVQSRQPHATNFRLFFFYTLINTRNVTWTLFLECLFCSSKQIRTLGITMTIDWMRWILAAWYVNNIEEYKSRGANKYWVNTNPATSIDHPKNNNTALKWTTSRKKLIKQFSYITVILSWMRQGREYVLLGMYRKQYGTYKAWKTV